MLKCRYLLALAAPLLAFFAACGSPTTNKKTMDGDRVGAARAEKDSLLRAELAKLQVHGAFELYIRAFKQEKELEVWVRSTNQEQELSFELLKTYPICAASGKLGHKNQEGDQQVPEGVYFIRNFNPQSRFHLSLGLNYPSEADSLRAKRLGLTAPLGSDIYIHGACVSVGCLAITDDLIKELYLLAFWARNTGQREVPVHIFPSRKLVDKQADIWAANPQFVKEWENLEPILKYFDDYKALPELELQPDGFWKLEIGADT